MFEFISAESQAYIVLDVLIAALLSGVIGWEREKFDKPAGLRTNMIVGSASCFFVAISPDLINFIGHNVNMNIINTDPTRILQAIVVGVSFIGAGTILKSKEENTVKFLTTAAVLLYSVAIGISVALKAHIVSVGLTVLALLINLLNNLLYTRHSYRRKDKK